MAEVALKRMMLDEFLRWEDGTDTRYELIEGHPVAMAPPMPGHGVIAVALGAELRAALRPRPSCFVQAEAGIARPERDDTCYVADLAVSCDPPRPGDRLIRDPMLIVEILSPGTAVFDRQSKIPDYRRIPSVQEILLIDSESIFAEILRRSGEQWITEIVRGPDAMLSLASIPLTVRMSELYRGLFVLEAPTQRTAGTS
jgi:Uma2 family endonuclease